MFVFRRSRRITSVLASLALVAGMASSLAVTVSQGTASAAPAPSAPQISTLAGLPAAPNPSGPAIEITSPTLPISGTADAGASVTVEDYGFAVATTTADGSGNWSVLLNVPWGVQQLSAVETLAGSTSPSSAYFYVELPQPDVNLVTNPLFEDPAVSSGDYQEFDYASGEGGVPGWQPTDIGQCAYIEIQNDEFGMTGVYLPANQGGSGDPTNHSDQWAELASMCVSGLQQTISTVPGTQYQLQFSYAGRPNTDSCGDVTYNQQNTMAVQWGSTPVTTVTGVSGTWKTVDFTLTATSDTTTVSFIDTNPCTTDTYGDYLDGVSVVPTIDLEPGNTTWATAQQIALSDPPSSTLTGSTSQALQFPGEDLWYDFPVQPGEQVNVSLTSVPADYNVYLFSDISQAFAAEASGASNVATLGAEASGSAFSGSAFSGSAFSGSAFSGSAFSGSAFSGSAFSGSAFSGSAFSGSAFSGSAFSGSAFSGSAFSGSAFSGSAFSTAYTSAESNSIIGLSTQQGAVDKSIDADTWNDTGNFYVLIAGNNDASSSTPYTLTVTTSGSTCVAPGGGALETPATLTQDGVQTINGQGSSSSTLIVENSTAMDSQYGNTAVTTMNGELQQLAAAENGSVVDLAGSAQVQDLAQQAAQVPTCPYAENLEAQAIQDIINSYRNSNLKYVVIVGDDDIIPFFRYPDQAGLAPESEYQPPLASTSPANSALEDNYYLTDDPYGTTTADQLDIQGSTLSLATLAVGRLVETPSDIYNTVARFLSENGVIAPTNGLATGYAFMAPAATSVDAAFGTGLGGSNVTSLIDNGNGGSSDPQTWSASTLESNLESVGAAANGAGSMVFLGAHFSANNLLAADDSSTLTTNTFAQDIGSDLQNSLVISPGCHSGYNIDSADAITGVTDPLAWPQALSEAGATLVAGTGYQYGDTNYTAYTDQVDVDLAQQLDFTENGAAPTIGTALLDAKQQYLSTLFQLDGIEVKALEQITLYGLPMLGVQMAGQAAPTTGSGTGSVMGTASNPVGVVGYGPGQALGLQSGQLAYTTPSFVSPEPSVANPSGPTPYTYESYGTGTQFTAVTGGPVLPVQTEDVNVNGDTLRGVVFLGGTYTDTPGVNPLTGDPATDTDNAIIPFSSSTFYPQTTWNPNYYNTISGANGGNTELAITPLQYTSDTSDLYATQRQYSGMNFQLYYDNNSDLVTSNSAYLAAPPQVTDVSSTYAAGAVQVTANVSGDPTAGVQDVWVTYTGLPGDPLYGTWASVQLQPSFAGSTTYTGSYTGDAGTEFMVQAVNGVGAVTMDTNEGYYFTPGTDPGTQSNSGANAYSLQLGGQGTGVYGTTATLSATLTPAVANQPITFTLGGATAIGYTGSSGEATATIPLTQAPGGYPLAASYFNAATGTTVSITPGTFTISAAVPSLTLTNAPAQVISGQPVSSLTAQLTGPGSQPLSQQTVYFVVTPVGQAGTVVGVGTGITNGQGVATSGPITLEPGDVGGGYQVSAVFGASVNLPGGGVANGAVTGYQSASSSADPVALVDPTQTGIEVSPTPVDYGQSLTLTATVLSSNGLGFGSPNVGTVSFNQGSPSQAANCTNGGAGTLTAVQNQAGEAQYEAQCVISGLNAGNYTFSASYSGVTGEYGTSTSSAAHTSVSPAPTSLAMALPASGQMTSGQPSLVTATLTNTATGSPIAGAPVYFVVESSLTSQVVYSSSSPSTTGANGVAQAGTISLPTGDVGPNYTIAAYFGPSPTAPVIIPPQSNYVSASAGPSALDVVDNTVTTLSAPSTVYSGNSIALSATVAPAGGGPAVETGTVTFYSSSGTPVCSGASLATGTATCTVTNPPMGSYSYYATYSGVSGYYAGSTSSPLASVSVVPGTTSVKLTASSNGSSPSSAASSAFGAAVTLAATVSVTNGAGTPTGTVTFYDGTGALGTSTLSNGTATLTVSGLLGGIQSLSAVYAGSTNFLGNTGTATDNVGFTKTISSSTNSSLTISSGQLVLVTGTLNGSISISQGGGLEVQGGTVVGSISESGGVGLALCGANVGGSISATGSDGFVFAGGANGTGTGCAASKIGGSISLSGNKAGLEIIGSTIGGSMSVSSNTGTGPLSQPNEIAGNKIGGSLACSGNSPAPTDAGQPNTLTGSRSGQCATPKNF